MRGRREVGLAIGALLFVQIATSFGAIALLGRMSPAIARILDENLYSLQAAAEMLEALALANEDRRSAEARFEAALLRAHSNVTEREEIPVLAAIDQHYRAALSGDPAARRKTIAGLRELASINHASTRRADADARRLGTAGAWAAVILGALGFVFSGLAISRLTRNALRPIADLGETVAAFRGGDMHRRSCRMDMPEEFLVIASALDDLLDALQAPVTEESPPKGKTPLGDLERHALIHYLSREQQPTLLLDTTGHVRCAGKRALELFDHSDLAQRLLAQVRQGPPKEGDEDLAWTPIEGGYLCSVTQTSWGEKRADGE